MYVQLPPWLSNLIVSGIWAVGTVANNQAGWQWSVEVLVTAGALGAGIALYR